MRARVLLAPLFCLIASSLVAEGIPSVVVFSDSSIQASDSSTPSPQQLKLLLPGAHLESEEQLTSQLDQPTTKLLVLPYGSAFPEVAWSAIYRFLGRGGSLLVLGGRPFTRAAYRDAAGWHLRDYSLRFARELLIDQYQVTPGSEGLDFETNPDVVTKPARFSWRHAFSPILRLSARNVNEREGSAGSLDARLDTLAWGTFHGRRLAAPVVQIDHLRTRFTGGRWIFLNAELGPDFYGSSAARQLIDILAKTAESGSEEFVVRPTLPLYLAGEPVELEVTYNAFASVVPGLSARITVSSEQQSSHTVMAPVGMSSTGQVLLPAPTAKGFYTIRAELLKGNEVRAVYRSGFWIRDESYLRSGPRLSVNRDYFELDGHPLAIVGTTYMASDVQRLFFEHPNVYIWDRDLEQIKAAGLNTIRTGWWTGWDKFCDENGQPYERTFRTLEAYLMTARKHGLTVQFTFFAFLPEDFGGTNAYLDPEVTRKQRNLAASIVTRFHDVPFLAWDLINEPSFSRHFWKTRPNEDPFELAAWNQWLARHYQSRASLAEAWNLPINAVDGQVSIPADLDFSPRGMYEGRIPQKLYDFYLFAQEIFANWVHELSDTIRATGSQQLITVGQDEGGYTDRLSPVFFGHAIDFTTNHSWWENDSLLWDSLVAKQPGLPMLIQETGIQRELALDEISRRSPENEASLLERKLAVSLVQGSGAIQWLWHTNAYMTEGNEAAIGAMRVDGTEKPEMDVMRRFARFSKAVENNLHGPKQPAVAIISSQAAQFSVIGDLQLEAQRNAVRALSYGAHQPAYIISENQIEKLGSPRLAILPSPQALNDSTWRTLIRYVEGGGNLLITGSLDRDQHWQRVERGVELRLEARSEPITYHYAEIHLGDRVIPLAFDQQKQSWLEALRFNDGTTFRDCPLGKGHLFWAAYPVELSTDAEATIALYSFVSERLNLHPPFATSKPPVGVLIYPTELQDSILYVMISESADDVSIDLRDNLTNGHLTLPLPAQKAALMLIRKSDGALLASY